MRDELEPNYDDGPRGRVDDEMKPLDQLKKYQFVIRKILPFLDAYEATALIQIVDRTTGWKKHEAIFMAQSLYAGDQLYGGISRSMHKSRMNKALASMEQRNLISREKGYQDDPRKYYRVNYDVNLAELERSSKPRSASANR